MWAVVWVALWAWGAAQYIGEENLSPIQQTAVIGGDVRDLDQIGPKIYTEKTNTTLNCASGYMLVDVSFKDPFYGIIYPNGSRNSACRIQGQGKTKYHLELPLKGCGTSRVERRVFVNNIIVRFHPGLELEGDEVKTIICRYPSPKVIPPPKPPVPIIQGPVAPGIPAPVSEVEILLIICAIVFLALLLVGMACSYTCLKKRNIKLVRRRPMSLGAPSDVTKVSGSSLIFDGVKIPRAHATSTSDSGTTLVSQSDTIPSDYPSDPPSSGSEVEELDMRSVERRSSAASSRMQEETIQAFSNQAFIMEEDRLSSAYSDALMQSDGELVIASQVTRPPQPSFMVRVKRAPTPPRTPEPDYPVQLAHSQSLTTIVERDESFRAESLPGSEHALLVSQSLESLMPPPTILPPPEYALIQRKTQTHPPRPLPPPSEYSSVARSVSEHDLEVDMRENIRRDIRHTENVQRVTTATTDVQETVEHHARRYLVPPPPSEPDSEYPSEARSVTDVVEELPVVPRRPEITSHIVDDRHVSTITETHTTEDIERHKRYIKQYHIKPKALPPPKWNVAIRHYPGPKYADEVESSGPEWEGYSEPGSDIFRQHLYQADEDDLTHLDVEALEHPPPPNWNVLLRVLEPPPTEEAVQYVLSNEDREKWRQIITTESTLRTMLTYAQVKEDYERIRHDQRYERLFEPRKWDVIIRILSPPDFHDHIDSSSEAPTVSDTESLPSRDGRRYKKNESVPSGRRPSLPPLYEYDSEGNPVVMRRPGPPSARSRRSSKSSIHSGIDVRSVTETEVNFARGVDTWSEASGPSVVSTGPKSPLPGPTIRPDLTYTVPVLPDQEDEYPDTDFDDRMSARTGRSLARSASEFTEDWRHHEPVDRYSHVSGSSIDSKRRQLERSTSEYFEQPPHFSDVMTSPDHSPEPSPGPVARFQQHQQQYLLPQFSDDVHYMEDDDVVEGGYVLRTERRSQHQESHRVEHRSDRSTHSGREEMYSVAETEVSNWARKH